MSDPATTTDALACDRDLDKERCLTQNKLWRESLRAEDIWIRNVRVIVLGVALILLLVILGCQGPPNGCGADDGTAGRYHLRERVGDFFDRAVAGRYHLRTRTAKFFGRGTC